MRIATALCSLLAASCLVHADPPIEKFAMKSVKARTLELKIPATWKTVATTSKMRAAQFAIPHDSGDADMVVFYFGGPTGGVKANVDRWIGQFDDKDRKLEMFQGKCTAGRYILVDTIGTWNKPDGPPFAQKKIATPGSRVLNVIVIEKKDGNEYYYFIKLSGSQDVVTKQTETLRKVIGADIKTEKPFDLKDAPN